MEKTNLDLFLEKLENDKDFLAAIFVEDISPEDIQRISKENGIEISLEEIDQAKEILTKAFDKLQEGELSDNSLEDVAGGFAITAAGVATGIAIAGGVVELYKNRNDIKNMFKSVFKGW